MADGTLRITFDVEPSEAGAAFALFGKPGTPAALAALQVGYAAVQESAVSTKHERSEIVDKPKGGPLSKEAAALCRNPAFLRWLDEEQHMNGDANEETAAEWIRQECEVYSRAEFDTDLRKGVAYVERVRVPFVRRERATA
jgi:hypothetical protein